MVRSAARDGEVMNRRVSAAARRHRPRGFVGTGEPTRLRLGIGTDELGDYGRCVHFAMSASPWCRPWSRRSMRPPRPSVSSNRSRARPPAMVRDYRPATATGSARTSRPGPVRMSRCSTAFMESSAWVRACQLTCTPPAAAVTRMTSARGPPSRTTRSSPGPPSNVVLPWPTDPNQHVVPHSAEQGVTASGC